MIINIPLQVDEVKMEEAVRRDYKGKVTEEIIKHIEESLIQESTRTYGDKTTRKADGMKNIIKLRIDAYLSEHSDEIINATAILLAEKLARSKRGKELLEKAAEVSE